MAIKELVHVFQIGLEVRSRRLNKTSEKCACREYNTRSRVLFAVADRVERTERGLANQMTADRTMANAYVDTVTKLDYEASGVRAREGDGEVYSRPLEALDYDFDLSKLERVMCGSVKLPRSVVPAVLHEVKGRAVVDKPITKAEVVELLEASH
jgi:hypothetical protein